MTKHKKDSKPLEHPAKSRVRILSHPDGTRRMLTEEEFAEVLQIELLRPCDKDKLFVHFTNQLCKLFLESRKGDHTAVERLFEIDRLLKPAAYDVSGHVA